MADQRIQSTEEMVGAAHATKADTLNRLTLVEHETDGTHKDKGYIRVSDVKAQNTNGGTFTGGAWRTRDVNTEDCDSANICSIAANQITLEPGTYECTISAPAMTVGAHQLRLYNITDAEVPAGVTGTIENSSGYAQTRSTITGRFTITAQKTFEIQHYAVGSLATLGFGIAMNIASEVYTVAEFRRVAY